MHPNLELALKFLFHNGFGFELSNETVVFAKIGEQQLNLAQLQKIAPTCIELDFLGTTFVGVNYKEYTKIPALFQAMIDAGLSVKPHMKDSPVVFRNEPFSWASLERKIVNLVHDQGTQYLAQKQGITPEAACYKLFNEPIAWNQPWNWHTKEGKAFCARLPSTDSFNFFEMPNVSNGIKQFGLALWE